MIKKILSVGAPGEFSVLKANGFWKSKLLGDWCSGAETITVSPDCDSTACSTHGFLFNTRDFDIYTPHMERGVVGFVEVTLSDDAEFCAPGGKGSVDFHKAMAFSMSPLMRVGDLTTWEKLFTQHPLSVQEKNHLVMSFGTPGTIPGLLEKMCELYPPDSDRASYLYVRCLEKGYVAGADWIAATMHTNEDAICSMLMYSYHIMPILENMHGMTENMQAHLLSRVDILDTPEQVEQVMEKMGAVSYKAVLMALKINPAAAKALLPHVKGL